MKTTLFALLFFIGSHVAAQEGYVPPPESDSEIAVRPNQSLTIPNPPLITASSNGQTEVAKAALAIVLNGSNARCEPGSQIHPVVEAYADSPLEVLSNKLEGTSCLTHGVVQHVNALFTPNRAIQADSFIIPVIKRKLLLLKWKGAFYVLYGVVYDEHIYQSGRRDNVIRELLLIDPRYSGRQRLVAFEREKDNLADIEGVTSVSIR